MSQTRDCSKVFAENPQGDAIGVRWQFELVRSTTGNSVELVRNFAMSVSNKTRVLAVESIGQVPLLDALDSPMFESNAIARFRRVEL
ncbi:hypothetical protein RND71_016022 [Anisodus tanguticus]|uniref:Uncharacterized protein n=1 Tax=Anisodus tanguticus TaxID=243964 RepID=A0AAE1S5D4_9SOLA|nr:hypothetical protein RND71_016022 [Anisodus tanguticus]